jgi:hypothetical protein
VQLYTSASSNSRSADLDGDAHSHSSSASSVSFDDVDACTNKQAPRAHGPTSSGEKARIALQNAGSRSHRKYTFFDPMKPAQEVVGYECCVLNGRNHSHLGQLSIVDVKALRKKRPRAPFPSDNDVNNGRPTTASMQDDTNKSDAYDRSGSKAGKNYTKWLHDVSSWGKRVLQESNTSTKLGTPGSKIVLRIPTVAADGAGPRAQGQATQQAAERNIEICREGARVLLGLSARRWNKLMKSFKAVARLPIENGPGGDDTNEFFGGVRQEFGASINHRKGKVKMALQELAHKSAMTYIQMLVDQYGKKIPGRKCPARALHWYSMPQFATIDELYSAYRSEMEAELVRLKKNPKVSSVYYQKIVTLYSDLAMRKLGSNSVLGSRIDPDELFTSENVPITTLVSKHILSSSQFTKLFAHRCITKRGHFYNVRFPVPGKWKLGVCCLCEDFKYLITRPELVTASEYKEMASISSEHDTISETQRQEMEKNQRLSIMPNADTMAIAFDCAAGVQLPSDPKKDHLRDSRLTFPIFGIEEHERQSIFVTHTGQFGKGPNLIITNLVLFLRSTIIRRCISNVAVPRRLTIQMDNCGSENKNRYVIFVCALFIMWNWFDTVELNFMLTGHTHGNTDGKFGNFQSKASRKKCCHSLKDLESIAAEVFLQICAPARAYVHGKTQLMFCDAVMDWKDYLAKIPTVATLIAVSDPHSFKLDSNSDRSAVYMAVRNYASDPFKEPFLLLAKQDVPPIQELKMLAPFKPKPDQLTVDIFEDQWKSEVSNFAYLSLRTAIDKWSQIPQQVVTAAELGVFSTWDYLRTSARFYLDMSSVKTIVDFDLQQRPIVFPVPSQPYVAPAHAFEPRTFLAYPGRNVNRDSTSAADLEHEPIRHLTNEERARRTASGVAPPEQLRAIQQSSTRSSRDPRTSIRPGEQRALHSQYIGQLVLVY